MSRIYFRKTGATSDEPVDEQNPFPVDVVKANPDIAGRTAQVSVATTATLIAPANRARASIKITNVTGAQVVYLGFGVGVSSTTGDYLHSTAGSSTTIYAKGPIYGIAVSAAQTVSVLEESVVQ